MLPLSRITTAHFVFSFPFSLIPSGESIQFDYSSKKYFTSITMSFLKTLTGVKSVPFCFYIFFSEI